MDNNTYVAFTYNDLSIIQKAIEEQIFSLSQDRFYAEQAERYSEADSLRQKLCRINEVRKRLKYTRERLIHQDIIKQSRNSEGSK